MVPSSGRQLPLTCSPPAPPSHFNVGLLAVSQTPMLFPALALCLWALRKAGFFHTHGSVYIWAQERGPCISTLFVFFIILNTVSFPFSSSTPLRCRLCVLLALLYTSGGGRASAVRRIYLWNENFLND